MLKNFTFVILLVLIWGCNAAFLTNYNNDPLGNYDFYFNELEEVYAYKNYRFENGRSLNEIRILERSLLENDPTWQNLVTTLGRVMSEHIQDPHLYSLYSPIIDPSDTAIRAARGTNYDNYLPQFPLAGSVFSNFTLTTGELMDYGILSNINANPVNIGYVYIKLLTLSVGGSSRLTQEKGAFGKAIDQILNYFQTQNVESLIIDIRSDAGGAVNNGRDIAGRMVNAKRIFMLSDNKIGKDQYQRVEEYVEPQGVSYYQNRPVMVLVNTDTCSGGEMLALMLRQSGNFKKVIGTPTRGCAGTILDRELPNGWIMRITSSRTYTPDETDYFKTGLIPDTILTAGNTDRVLSNAVFQLQNP